MEEKITEALSFITDDTPADVIKLAQLIKEMSETLKERDEVISALQAENKKLRDLNIKAILETPREEEEEKEEEKEEEEEEEKSLDDLFKEREEIVNG